MSLQSSHRSLTTRQHRETDAGRQGVCGCDLAAEIIGRGPLRRAPERGVMLRGARLLMPRAPPLPISCPTGRCDMPTLCSTTAPFSTGACGIAPYGLVATPDQSDTQTVKYNSRERCLPCCMPVYHTRKEML